MAEDDRSLGDALRAAEGPLPSVTEFDPALPRALDAPLAAALEPDPDDRPHEIAEVADAAAMTVFNPLTIAYWVGVTANWLPFAHSVLGYSAPGFGIVMATAGLMTWFTALTVIVRFMPHRIGPTFFRVVNAAFGLILLAFATFCATVVSRHFLH